MPNVPGRYRISATVKIVARNGHGGERGQTGRWRDKFPKVNVPTPEERRVAQEKFGHLFKN